jgi:uncharacterized protein YndB with AHSA1/START domain
MNAVNAINPLKVETPADEPIIIMTRTLNAPRALVWKAWTEPQHIARWWGPRSYNTKVVKQDVRVGGEWRYEQQTPEGDAYVFIGRFLEVVEPEKLVNTFGVEGMFEDKTLVETHTFEERDGRTFYKSVSRFDTIEDRDGMVASGMEEGARDSMDKLEELLAELQQG